jgi:hypothetical protein
MHYRHSLPILRLLQNCLIESHLDCQLVYVLLFCPLIASVEMFSVSKTVNYKHEV